MNPRLKDSNAITQWLDYHEVEQYDLIPDKEHGFKVDVKSDVNLTHKKLNCIPIKFNIIQGNFDCGHNSITSLWGCPVSVKGNFGCYHNTLTSLVGGPSLVNGDYLCWESELTSLMGAPKKIGKDFSISGNNLVSLKGSPNVIGGHFDCGYNQLINLEGCPQKVGRNFYCNNNHLASLEFCPQSVVGGFMCDANPLLGDVQRVVNFNKICEIHQIEKEKNTIEKWMKDQNNCLAGKPHKI